MRRNVRHLRPAAEALTADLRQAAGGSWRLGVHDGFALRVEHDGRTTDAPIEPDVNEDWLRGGSMSSASMSEDPTEPELADDASEAVAAALGEALWNWRIEWPVRCATHEGRPLTVCSGRWVCDSRAPHDVAEVGTLVRSLTGR